MSKWPGAPRPCEQPQTNPSLRQRRASRNHGVAGYHGDPLQRRDPNNIRILLHNPGGIGFIHNKRCLQTLKMEKLKKLIIQHEVDLVGLCEVNKDWRKVEQNHTIWNATSNWKKNRRVQTSQNSTKPPRNSEFLVGGTATIAFDDLVPRICDQGEDFRKLGRWNYITIAGKNNIRTSIFTCYCPCHGKSPGSTYSQHLTYMSENVASNLPTICPRQLFGIDLKSAIEEKVRDGHQMIIMGDFNSHYNGLTNWMMNVGLIDIHHNSFGPGPITHTRSKSEAIDRVFVSPHLQMAKGGFLSFSKLMSDHRGLWMDIPKILLFGYNPPLSQTFSARRLQLEDPRVVKRYLDQLFYYMTETNLFHRMERIYSTSVYPLPTWAAQEYEEIDKEVCRYMYAAEKSCRKLKAGSIQWSPTYQKACVTLEYWLRRRSYFNKKFNNVRHLLVLQKKAGLQYDQNLSLQDINNKISLAYAKKSSCKKNAESFSLEYRTQLALAKEAAGECEAATYLKTRNAIESKRRLFRNIRHIEGKMRGGFTSKIEVKSNNMTVEYTDRNSIEEKTIQANEVKYHQTEGGSQFLQNDFIASLGHHGEGPDINKVLQGNYTPPPSASLETQEYLSSCHFDGSPPPSTPISRYLQQKKSWRTRKESTCTYNHHIGHFKSIFRDKRLSWFFFQRADIPEISGYSPKRHRTCIDLMIMKKIACFDISKQRTIGILDTEFNQSNKRLGKDAMNQALAYNKVAHEQFAIKNVSPIFQIISRRCIVDHHMSKRKCFSMTSSDLAGCYDRIVHTAAALAMLRVGVPHTKIITMFSTIQRMIHKIRTAFGDSKLSYGGNDIGHWQNYPQGVLQGNASGPTVWVLVSSVIFEILHKRGLSVKFCTALSQKVFQLVGFAYVDDCDLLQSGTDPVKVLTSMQQLINSWSSLMKVTGGAISVDKSWYYLVDYVWAKGKWTAHDATIGLDLIATSTDGSQVSLKRLFANEPSEMLGVWFTPNGNNAKIVSELKTIALQWGARIRLGNPSPAEAWQALTCTITPKLKYPLPACTLSEEECKSILFPAIRAALPKSRICSMLPGAVRDCPQNYGGLGISSLYHYQCTSRISIMAQQIFQQTPTGFLLIQNIEDLTLETGLYGPIWNMPFDLISKYVSQHSYVYHILKYNAENNISLSIPHETLAPQREGDQPIMLLASQYFSTTAELRSIQRVRLLLGVTHLSDISTANGYKMDITMFDTHLHKHHKNLYDWPSKHHTNVYDIWKWRKLLKYIFCLDNTSLPLPLGNWVHMNDATWLYTWDYFTTTDNEFLYLNKGENKWERYLKIPHSHRSYHNQPLHLQEAPTSSLNRVSITRSRNRLQVVSSSSQSNLPPPTETISNYDAIRFNPPKIMWFMNSIEHSTTTESLLNHIIDGTALGVSDGSYYPATDIGACAWIVSTPDGSEYISGGGIIPGPKLDQSAYRSELGGQLGLSLFLTSIKLPPTATPTITIACDGKAALGKVAIDKCAVHSKDKHVDFISIISELWNDSQLTPLKQHVFGHQDVTGRGLTMLEKLNCWMDTKAKYIAQVEANNNQQHPNTVPTFILPSSYTIGLSSIVHNKKIITSKIQQSLYSSITKQNYIQWLSTKSTHPIDTTKVNIHWDSLISARKEVPIHMNLFITKWISGFTSSGKYMVRMKLRNNSSCPSCDHPIEDLPHILTCPSVTSTTLRQELLNKLQEWLQRSRTNSSLSSFILQGLTYWFHDPNHQQNQRHSNSHHQPHLQLAFNSQISIGWYNFLCGFISTSIVNVQQDYFVHIGSRKSGSRWAASLIIQLWKLIHQIWCHRNTIIHETNKIHSLSGLTPLQQSISIEYEKGYDQFPTSYSSYFHHPLSFILSKHITYQKNWFLIIRSAREAYDSDLVDDEFSSNEPLRRSIGLSKLP